MAKKEELLSMLVRREIDGTVGADGIEDLQRQAVKKFKDVPKVTIKVRTVESTGEDVKVCVFTKPQLKRLQQFTTQRFVDYMKYMWSERVAAVEPQLRAMLERIEYFDAGYNEAGVCECGQPIRYHYIYHGQKPKTRLARHLGTSKAIPTTDSDLVIGSTCISTFLDVGPQAEKYLNMGANEVNKEKEFVAKILVAANGDFSKWLRGFVWRAVWYFKHPKEFDKKLVDEIDGYLSLGLPLPAEVEQRLMTACRTKMYAAATITGSAEDVARSTWRVASKYYPTITKHRLFELAKAADKGDVKAADEFKQMVGRVGTAQAIDIGRMAEKLMAVAGNFHKEEKKKFDEITENGYSHGFVDEGAIFLKMLWQQYGKEEKK